MNRTDFILELNEALKDLPYGERREIIADYEEHFRTGAATGKSEEQIAYELGAPWEIAKGYYAEASSKRASERNYAGDGTERRRTEYVRDSGEPFSEVGGKDKKPLTIPRATFGCMSIFTGILCIPLIVVLYAVAFALFAAAWAVGVAFTVGGIWAAISSFAVFATVGLKIGAACLGAALAVLGIIIIIAMARGSFKLLKRGFSSIKYMASKMFGRTGGARV